MGIGLYDYQLDAVHRMKNGCILCGGVGSGKSRTALAYYYILNKGAVNKVGDSLQDDVRMQDPIDLYIITTARKRDTKDWDVEMAPFLMNEYSNKITVDSWNNISKYVDVENAFFIFDEQRVVGKGAWAKSFLKITKKNQWILLSATPGDKWEDYIPVFVANGFYRNRSDFYDQHCIFSTFTTYPKIDRYLNTKKLSAFRDSILVTMDYEKRTVPHDEYVMCEYDSFQYKEVTKRRWNPFTNDPIVNAASLCYIWREVVNASNDRQDKLIELIRKHPRTVIFYNFDYELYILEKLVEDAGIAYAEWNGHKHEPIPETNQWAYLVQYTAGCEGWNCIKTDTIIFYSQNYSYKIMEQARGRIDRLNTPFSDLYYYHLVSRAPIDIAIRRALNQKRDFNQSRFTKKLFDKEGTA